MASRKAQRARENQAYVRMLLRQRQPAFAAALSSAEQYVSCLADPSRTRLAQAGDRKPQVVRPDGASRARARARATASVRPCTPSLAKRWRTCVRTVCTDRDSSRAISGVDKLVGIYRSTRISPWLSGSVSRGDSASRGDDPPRPPRSLWGCPPPQTPLGPPGPWGRGSRSRISEI